MYGLLRASPPTNSWERHRKASHPPHTPELPDALHGSLVFFEYPAPYAQLLCDRPTTGRMADGVCKAHKGYVATLQGPLRWPPRYGPHSQHTARTPMHTPNTRLQRTTNGPPPCAAPPGGRCAAVHGATHAHPLNVNTTSTHAAAPHLRERHPQVVADDAVDVLRTLAERVGVGTGDRQGHTVRGVPNRSTHGQAGGVYKPSATSVGWGYVGLQRVDAEGAEGAGRQGPGVNYGGPS